MEKYNLDKQRAYFGIEYEVLSEDNVLVSQRELKTGRILNQKELVRRGKEIYPDKKITPNVFTLDVSGITLSWIQAQMQEHGLKASDLVKHLAFEKGELSKILNGKVSMSKKTKAALFFYFRTFELNRGFDEFLAVAE